MSKDRTHTLSLAFMRGHPAQAARRARSPARRARPPRCSSACRHGSAPACWRRCCRSGAARCVGAAGRCARARTAGADGRRSLPSPCCATCPSRVADELIAACPPPRRWPRRCCSAIAEDTLGAWADPDVVVLPADTRAGDALAAPAPVGRSARVVFVADAERRLVGIVGLGAAAAGAAGATAGHADAAPARAAGRACAARPAAAPHPGWEQHVRCCRWSSPATAWSA